MRMDRLLPFAVALPLLGAADVGHTAGTEYNIDIVAVDLAGRQTNLTHNPAIDVNPAVARDGRVAFVSSRDGSSDLYVMDGDGRNVRRLTNGALDPSGIALAEDLEWSQASWSPRGDTIAFDGKYTALPPPCPQHCADWEVLAIGSDGKGPRQVAPNARAPAWSPDARRLAYESGVDAYYAAGGVTMMRLDGSVSVQVEAMNNESSVGPVWSPRGDEIAFQAARGNRTWIYLVRGDGERKRPLAAGAKPTWSPDGRRLAFVENHNLIAIDRNGRGKERLSRKGEFVIAAAWSPNSRTVAYVAGTKADPYGGLPRKLRLETVIADRNHVRVLASWSAGSLIWGSPVWTPSGRRILVAVEPH